MNRQTAQRNIKEHFKERIFKTRIHFLDIKQLIKEKPTSYSRLKESLSLARSSLKLEIHLHNLNLREARVEFDKYKKISNDILDCMMYSDDTWSVGIVDLSAKEKTDDDYVGDENSESEDLRRMSENMMENIKMYENDIDHITHYNNIFNL